MLNKSHEFLTAVPVTKVEFTDQFWAPRIEANRTTTLPQCFHHCEVTHRIQNFEVAGGLKAGEFEGIYFNDSDLYKVVEGAAYILATYQDPKLETYLDGLIGKFAAAQQEDGYLNTYYTLVEPDKRWSNLPVMHELYCAGHLFEAAVAHYHSTGKQNLLDIATRFADEIDNVFGYNKLVGVPGHEEIELALVKLYQATNEKRYLDLAKFFIDERGKSDRDYAQDHIPIREQSQIVGHAVRAMYLYAGVADVVRYTHDKDLFETMDRIWDDVTLHKMYITGGIGPSAHNEGFTVPYDLPNETAYAETCAAIGMVFWSHRMFLLHGHVKYIDILEQALYNGSISGVSLTGDQFFYVNPLASRGNHHRQPWYGCACCPTNIVRFIPQVGGYFYATSSDAVWVNLYAANRAEISLDNRSIEIIQETDYPWSGHVKLVVRPTHPTTFKLHLRIPEWCAKATAKINQKLIEIPPDDNGYLSLDREWQLGDTIDLEMPMPIDRIISHPKVVADHGYTCLRRGPVVYCLEATDNGGSVRDIALPQNTHLEPHFEEDLLGGVTVLRGKAWRRSPIDWENQLYQTSPLDKETEITAVPYHAWDNREVGPMSVWLPESTILAEAKLKPTIAIEGEPSASFVFNQLDAINDNLMPSGSNDQTIPRFTWWDQRGTSEWISLTFGEPKQISCAEIYWFDDGDRGECRIPESWEVEWYNGTTWQPVTNSSAYGIELDVFNRVSFDAVQTTSIRVTVQLQEGMSGGILEWRLPQ